MNEAANGRHNNIMSGLVCSDGHKMKNLNWFACDTEKLLPRDIRTSFHEALVRIGSVAITDAFDSSDDLRSKSIGEPSVDAGPQRDG